MASTEIATRVRMVQGDRERSGMSSAVVLCLEEEEADECHNRRLKGEILIEREITSEVN